MAKTRADVESKLATIKAKTYADTIAGKLESIEDHSILLGIETSYLGITTDNPKLAASTEAVAGIINKGTISEEVQEGESYTLAAGYYAGGTITGVAGGGHYELTTATATPTDSEQTITPPSGYYGLSSVTVDPIPENYKNTDEADAVAANVLSGKKFVNSTGTVTGTMTNNGVVTTNLTPSNSTYALSGYYASTSSIGVTSADEEIDPTEEGVEISYTDKFIGKVTVNPINVQSVLNGHTSGTAVAGDIFVGKTAWVDGVQLTGTMVDQSDWDAAAHIITTNDTGDFSVAIPEGWHDGTGTVKVVAQNKTAAAIVPGGTAQTIIADAGKVLNSVTVPALDSKYQDVSGVTAVADHVCAGYKFVNSSGTLVTGTLPENGALSGNIYNALLGTGPSGGTLLSGTNGHYTSVSCTIGADLYTRLAAI